MQPDSLPFIQATHRLVASKNAIDSLNPQSLVTFYENMRFALQAGWNPVDAAMVVAVPDLQFRAARNNFVAELIRYPYDGIRYPAFHAAPMALMALHLNQPARLRALTELPNGDTPAGLASGLRCAPVLAVILLASPAHTWPQVEFVKPSFHIKTLLVVAIEEALRTRKTAPITQWVKSKTTSHRTAVLLGMVMNELEAQRAASNLWHVMLWVQRARQPRSGHGGLAVPTAAALDGSRSHAHPVTVSVPGGWNGWEDVAHGCLRPLLGSQHRVRRLQQFAEKCASMLCRG